MIFIESEGVTLYKRFPIMMLSYSRNLNYNRKRNILQHIITYLFPNPSCEH
ncbi:unnamed protein product [Prunus brigantina]